MRRQVGPLEDVDLDGGAIRIEEESRVTETGAPTDVHDRPVNLSA